MLPSTIPTEITDPINASILSVSEDRIAGFLDDPFSEIARLASGQNATTTYSEHGSRTANSVVDCKA